MKVLHLPFKFFLVISIFLLMSQNIYAKKINKVKQKVLKFTEDEFKKEISKRFLQKIKAIKDKGVVTFSNELMAKEQKIIQKELILKREFQKLEMSKKDFTGKIITLEKKQSKLIGCIDKIDQQRVKRINHMVDTMASMKPATAADLLSVQEPDLSVQILGQLPSTKVSKIFNLMDKEISARLQKQYMNMQK